MNNNSILISEINEKTLDNIAENIANKILILLQTEEIANKWIPGLIKWLNTAMFVVNQYEKSRTDNKYSNFSSVGGPTAQQNIKYFQESYKRRRLSKEDRAKDITTIILEGYQMLVQISDKILESSGTICRITISNNGGELIQAMHDPKADVITFTIQEKDLFKRTELSFLNNASHEAKRGFVVGMKTPSAIYKKIVNSKNGRIYYQWTDQDKQAFLLYSNQIAGSNFQGAQLKNKYLEGFMNFTNGLKQIEKVQSTIGWAKKAHNDYWDQLYASHIASLNNDQFTSGGDNFEKISNQNTYKEITDIFNFVQEKGNNADLVSLQTLINTSTRLLRIFQTFAISESSISDKIKPIIEKKMKKASFDNLSKKNITETVEDGIQEIIKTLDIDKTINQLQTMI